MCGIAGGFAFGPEGKKYLAQINKAICALSHRGPDGEGIFCENNIAIAHRRLSIIDTSSEANQPMFSRDGRYCIVFNGEIFNYRQLKEKFLRDFPFRTSSDTEVFLELFALTGANSFKELRGFFAAAIYDRQSHELYLVRDRFGKKPVHIYKDDNVLLFASELKSLLAFGISREINREVLPFYFQLNYIPQPLSILKNVLKLMPGHYIKISGENVENVAEHCYYDLAIRKQDYKKYSYEDAQKKLVQLMDEATKLRLIADVPLGSFLSGGIDSSIVVALASRHEQQLKTFSIGFKDQPFFDETAYAELVAKKYKTQHTVFSLTNNDLLEHIDTILRAIDEPFADSSLIPTFILSRHTRKHVTVALSGDGGDEIFAGYNKYMAEFNAMKPSVAKDLIKGLKPLWKLLPKSRSRGLTNRVRQLHRFAEGASLQPDQRYWKWASMYSSSDVETLMHEKYIATNKDLQSLYNFSISGEDINEVLLADVKLVLLSDMLVKVDMMSMANSLEVRCPFLDQQVVDFAFGLPPEYKIDKKFKKKIVQDAFRELLPPELYNRPKQGFDVPLLQWFRKELWNTINDDLLNDRFVSEQQIFNLDTVQALKKKLFSSNPEDAHETIWALVVFQSWWKQNIA